jgi:hypothetical protein
MMENQVTVSPKSFRDDLFRHGNRTNLKNGTNLNIVSLLFTRTFPNYVERTSLIRCSLTVQSELYDRFFDSL